MKRKIPHPSISRHVGSTSQFDLDEYLHKAEKFDLDSELEKISRRARGTILEDSTKFVEGRPSSGQRAGGARPSLDKLFEGPWPPGLDSTYFVQAEGDVKTFDRLIENANAFGFGVATNAINLQRSPAMKDLVIEALAYRHPVFIDSGAARATKDEPLDWEAVFETYLTSGTPSLSGAYVVAPDVIPGKFSGLTPGMAAYRTRQLQKKYIDQMQALAGNGAKVIFPMQATDAKRFSEDAHQVWNPRGPARDWAVLGIPGRDPSRMPVFPLLRFLVSIVCSRPINEVMDGKLIRHSIGVLLPRIHFLGVGSSERIHKQVQLIRVVYRALRSGAVTEWIKRRSGLFAGLTGRLDIDEITWTLMTASPDDLIFLTSCVETRSTFPCPPYSTESLAGSHPKVNEAMRVVWESNPDQSFMRPGTDRLTREILGREDVSVDWYGFVEKYSDWTELCVDAIEEAERSDPCMVASAWDADDVEFMIGQSFAGRITSDSTTISIASKNAIWIRNGKQSKKTTPAWWKKKSRAYRFLWNLRAMLWDRYMREVSLQWRAPQDYNEEGFTF